MAPAEGFAAIPNWLIRDKSFSWRDRAVYMVLASRTGREGTWAMSLDQIADEADMSVSSVQRARTALRLAGAISWETPVAETGKGKAVYRVHSSVQRPADSRTGQSDLSAGPVNLTEPTSQFDLTGPVNLTSPDDVQEDENRIGQSDQSGPVTLTDRKKNRSSNSPSVVVPAQAQAAPPKKPQPERKRGTRIDPEFVPSPESRKAILEQVPGITGELLLAEHRNFIDYWISATGRNATKLEWDAAWRKWMRDTDWTKVRNRLGTPTVGRHDAGSRKRAQQAEWRERYGVVVFDDDTEASVAARAGVEVAS